MTRYVLQDPNSTMQYQLDWSDWLATGDTIASYAWSITPAAVLAGESGPICIVAGLEAGNVYHLRCRIVTGQALTDDRSIVIRAENT